MKLALVEPTYLSAKVPNNKWMEDMTDEERQVNLPVAYRQWFNLYSLLTQGATVYLVPPKPQYQDQCYDAETEVYTRNGWKKFKDITLEDEILSLNPKTLEMEYVKPIKKQEYPYSGKMYHFTGKEVDLRVTEDHNVVCLQRVKGHPDKYTIRFAKPSELSKNPAFLSVGGKFKLSTTSPQVILEEYRGENGRTYPKREFRSEDWFSLIGWYLSEGSVTLHNNHYHIIISQTIYAKEVKQLLERMNLPYYFDGKDFQIADKGLYEFFRQFGKAEERFIPQEIQDSVYLPYLIDSLLKGDGNKKKTEYYTKSKRLADDVQAALIKLGFRANIRRNKDGSYVVHFSKKNSWCRKVNIEEVQNEMVYDVSLPKNHIMLVRRNGKALWSGNCYVVNAGVVLPHLQLYQNRNVCVLSKFKAEARPGEELELKKLVEELGYETYQCPYYFEGEAELKWLNENVYVGGYGIRTSKRAHAWLEEQFGCKIIPVETDEWLYHLDCLVFPISNDYCIICEDIPQDTKDQIKKYTNVIEVPYDNCLEGITNSFRLNSYVLNADVSKSVTGMQALKQIKSEQQKLTEICADLGLTPVFIDLSEFLKSGALLSCMILHLTWEECWLG
jgi:N-dimethylarginine dimethylaminohydrolase